MRSLLVLVVIFGFTNESLAFFGFRRCCTPSFDSVSCCNSYGFYTTTACCLPTRAVVYNTSRSIVDSENCTVCDPEVPNSSGVSSPRVDRVDSGKPSDRESQRGASGKAPAPKVPFDRGGVETPEETLPELKVEPEFKAPAPKVPTLNYDRARIPQRGVVKSIKWIWLAYRGIRFSAPVINGYMPRVYTNVTMDTKEIVFYYATDLKYERFANRIQEDGYVEYGRPSTWKKTMLVSN